MDHHHRNKALAYTNTQPPTKGHTRACSTNIGPNTHNKNDNDNDKKKDIGEKSKAVLRV